MCPLLDFIGELISKMNRKLFREYFYFHFSVDSRCGRAYIN